MLQKICFGIHLSLTNWKYLKRAYMTLCWVFDVVSFWTQCNMPLKKTLSINRGDELQKKKKKNGRE